MFSKTPSKKANRKLSKIIAGGAATDSIEGNTSEKPAKTSMKKRKSNGRSDGSAEAGAPQMMVTCIEPQSEPRKKNEKSGAVPSEELKLGAKPLKRKFKSEPMPSLRMGFAIKCKKDDQSQRFDLVVESQLANRVYIVKNSKNDRLCCLKIEPYESSNELKQLKRDVFVLLDAVKNPHYGNKHFLPIVNKGVCQEFFNYLVIPLCEGNLVDIRENVVGGDFCSETAVRLTFDTFQAITDLHGLGHVHRCVAPSKFVVGREGKGLYLVGLSFAIRHVNPSQSSPRKLEHFGPNRYQSRAWHRNKHQFRRDDLESWLFMVIEFFGVKLIPWNADMSDMEVLVQKERLFNDGFEEIFKVAPKQFELLLNFLNKMTSQDKPDYEFIACTLVTIREKIQCELKGPYDWTAQGAKKKVVSNKKLKKASKKLVGSEDEEDEPERPGKTSLHKKKAPKTQVETDEDEAQFVSKPKRKPAPSLAEEPEDDVETERSRPKQKKKKKKASVEQENDGGEEEADKSPKPKKKSKKKRVPQPEEVEDDEETVPPVKAPKKKKPVIENLTEAADVVSPKPPNKKKSKGKVSQVPSKEEDSNSDPENDQTEILAKPAKKSKKKAEKTGESTEQFPLEMDKKKPPKQQAPKPAKEPSELTPSEKQDVGLDPSDQAVPSTNSAASEAKAEAAPPSCYANP